MNNEVTVKKSENMVLEIQETQKMCQMLMSSPHYEKLGRSGIFAIVQKAKSIGVSPLDALNGGMYYVNGKVEMSATMMNQLIRMHKHSISKDKRSDSTICILHGKRADNNDTWVSSFSVDEAKQAGIFKNTWLRYPTDLLFARALSRLARQLFPDVIKGCYVQGEISEAPVVDPSESPPLLSNVVAVSQNESVISDTKEVSVDAEEVPKINEEEYQALDSWLGGNHVLRNNIATFIKKKWDINDMRFMPRQIYGHSLKRAKEQHVEVEQMYGEQLQAVAG